MYSSHLAAVLIYYYRIHVASNIQDCRQPCIQSACYDLPNVDQGMIGRHFLASAVSTLK